MRCAKILVHTSSKCSISSALHTELSCSNEISGIPSWLLLLDTPVEKLFPTKLCDDLWVFNENEAFI